MPTPGEWMHKLQCIYRTKHKTIKNHGVGGHGIMREK